jgi:hypothetical protein
MRRVVRAGAVAIVLWLLGAGMAEARMSVSYPTSGDPAAAQVGDIFDVDVRTTEAGVVEGALRRSGDEQWRPLDVVTLTREVPPGLSEATAIVPPGTPAGSYDLRVRLLDSGGAELAERVVDRSLVIEDYGLPTGFEARAGASWTTHAEELAFLDAIDASPRADADMLGTSVLGRPLHLVRIGGERDQRPVLIVCTQHGNEPAPRETCLRQIRRLAFTDDARTLEYLRSTTVYFIPTANPDGRELNTRGNAAGLDLNRDHLRLSTVEARAMARSLRDLRPDFVADLHEFGTSSPDRPALEVIWPRHLNVDEDVRSLGREWGDEWMRPRSEANGFSTGPYIANPGTGETSRS